MDKPVGRVSRVGSSSKRQTFEEATRAFLVHQNHLRAGTRFPTVTGKHWAAEFELHLFPALGELDVAQIRHVDIVQVLGPLALFRNGKKQKGLGGPNVARRLRARIERVLDFAAVHGFRDPDRPNPARAQLYRELLFAPPGVHHAAPRVAEAPALYRRIRDTEGVAYRAVEFMILTACRIREALDAIWSELDLERKIWVIPASRTKCHRDHIVPLSSAAIACLERAGLYRSPEATDLIFRGRFGAMATSTPRIALRVIGVEFTRHGWRSVCRDAMSDELGVDDETAEFVLGHIKRGLEGAYRRGTALAKRAIAMQAYAGFLGGTSSVSAPTSGAAGSLMIETEMQCRPERG
jgi:integrase